MADLKSTTINGTLQVDGETFTTNYLVVNNDAKFTGILELGKTPEATGEKNYAVGTHDLLDLFYPVGTVYISTVQDDGTNGRPDTRSDSTKNGCPIAYNLGGSWVRFAGARSIVGYGETIDEAGQKSTVSASEVINGVTWGNRSLKLLRHSHGGYTGLANTRHYHNFQYKMVQWPDKGHRWTIGDNNGFWAPWTKEEATRTHETGGQIPNPGTSIDSNGYHKHSINPAGTVTSDDNGKNWQPSIGVFMWKRIA